MISFFRNFFQSKIGLPIFIGFLILVALAFAAADITGSTFGGVSGTDRVAKVGDETITTSELARSAESTLRNIQRENPTVSMQQLVAEGGLEEVLNQLTDRYAIAEYAEEYGLRAGDNLVNSEILKLGAFTGPTGEFDQNAYEAALRRMNMTDEALRRDISQGLLAQQLLIPALAAPQMPEKAAKHYAALLLERRRGEIAFIPSMSFAPESEPTDEQLQAYYKENRSRYVLPERRVIRYAVLGADKIDADITPTADEIRAFYEANAERFAAKETRDVTSFLVPTEEAAKAIVARIRAGTPLETAAREAGFNVSKSEGQTREEIASSLGSAVAESVFSADQGKIAEPARSSLGWYVARVDKITRTPARTLAQATPEITEELTAQKRRAALDDLSARIEQEVDGGTSLLEVAEAFNLDITRTPPLLADGRVFGQQGQSVSPGLRPILETAFQMDESEPQLAEIVPGQQFLVFDVEEITESAAPPLKDVRERVVFDWKLAQGAKAAREVADRVLEKVRGDTSVQAALSEEETRLPPVEKIDLERRQLFANPQQNPPPPLVLMFSMAEGSVKLYEAPNNIGWYLVKLEDIVTDDIDSESPVLQQTRATLAPALGAEYSQQIVKAIRDEVGVEINEDAIAALRKRLAGDTD